MQHPDTDVPGATLVARGLTFRTTEEMVRSPRQRRLGAP